MEKYSKIDKLYLELTKDMKCVCCGNPAVVHTLEDFYTEKDIEGNYVISELGNSETYPAELSVVANVLCESCKNRVTDSMKINVKGGLSMRLAIIISELYFIKISMLALYLLGPEARLNNKNLVNSMKNSLNTSLWNEKYIADKGAFPIRADVIFPLVVKVCSRYSDLKAVEIEFDVDGNLVYVINSFTDINHSLLLTSPEPGKFTHLVHLKSDKITIDDNMRQFITEHFPELYRIALAD